MAERSPFDVATQMPSGLEIARQPLDEAIANHLRDLIIRGEMAPGAKIHLPELAAALGVSTTPVREALKILAEEEIVEWLPGRGVRVAPIRTEQTRPLFEVIASLEALAAEIAAERMSVSALAELEALHQHMREHFERGERDPYFDLNSRVHDLVLTFSANDILRATHARLHGRASRGRYIAIVDDARWREAMQEHEDLMDAFKDRNSARAHEIWRRHFDEHRLGDHEGATCRPPSASAKSFGALIIDIQASRRTARWKCDSRNVVYGTESSANTQRSGLLAVDSPSRSITAEEWWSIERGDSCREGMLWANLG
jgi:DNA-binding GntR family transcriptional regulator